MLDGPEGSAIRRAAADRLVIMDMVAKLPKEDRSMLPDIEATVKALVERVAQLAQMLHRLNESIDWRLVDELDARVADARRQTDSPEGQRRLTLLQRQRETLQGLVERRSELMRQLDSAGLALGQPSPRPRQVPGVWAAVGADRCVDGDAGSARPVPRHRSVARCRGRDEKSLTDDQSCDVQFGQREAAMGMSVAQNLHALVFGGAATGLAWKRVAMRTTMKTAKATIRKVMTVLRNWP